ncbi:MAG: hypothetical protein Q9166_005664 [cf. Caloplaca sp. 2 TL-2023]
MVHQALAEYEPRVLKKVSALRERIMQASSQPVLVNDLMRWFSFDLMGDFAFSEDFGMMQKREYHRAIQMLRSAITLLGPFSPAIWIPRLGFAFIPGLWKVKDWFGMLAFCDSCMERRMKACTQFLRLCLVNLIVVQTEVKERDIASWFIDDAKGNEGNKEHAKWLSGDTATVVVAGSTLTGPLLNSDTTAPSLITLLYLLARHPEDAEEISQELSTVDVQDVKAVAMLHHLNGAINEAMRLLPAVLTFVTRVTPPQGMKIGETYIPGNVKIAAPRYSIGRRKTSCVGKNLAMTEIRMVIASLLATFRIKFVPGDHGEAVERDMRDQLTGNPGNLVLVFEPR